MVAGMDELAKRVRAARGYAGMAQPELAGKLGVSTSTLKRIEGGKTSLQGFERDGFIRAAADATDLPAEFFTVDRESLGRPPDLLEPSQLVRPPHDEAALEAADNRARELEAALVEEFGKLAPGAALMFREVLDRLASIEQALRAEDRDLDKIAAGAARIISEEAAALEANDRSASQPGGSKAG